MSMVLHVHTEPFQAIRLTQNARLVSSNSVESERRMALARHMAFSRSHNSGTWGREQLKNILKINHAFSSKNEGRSVSLHSLKAASPTALLSGGDINVSNSSDYIADSSNTSGTSQTSSSYMVERAALEMRASSGDLTFIPPLVLTIITQYPSISFEYTGEFNQFPPSENGES